MTKHFPSFLRMHRAVILLVLLLASSAGTSANNEFNLAEYRGKVVVLDFWASWCVPCRRSFPWMNQMHEKYADDGLVIIGVNMDTQAGDADNFLAEYPAKFQILHDPYGELARTYDVVAMPSSYVFDRDGNQVTKHLGFKVKRQDEYEALLLETLQK
jgi:thiol-disulfide isomerase/thioredoxin